MEWWYGITKDELQRMLSSLSHRPLTIKVTREKPVFKVISEQEHLCGGTTTVKLDIAHYFI
jgi:hypothetical protein